MIRLNKREWILILAGLLAGLLIAVIVIPRGGHDDDHHGHAHADEHTEYTCSMHPQIRQDEPGDCPLCGMALTPVAQGGGMSDDGPFVYTMSPQAVALANIRTEKVLERASGKEVVLTGRVSVNEQRLSAITADFSGRIERLFVDFTGQQVTRGQKLATIYSPELVSAGQELIEAAKFKERQPQVYEAVKEKLRLWNLTEEQIADLESGRSDAARLDVVATRSGTVIARNIAAGDYVTRGSVLFQTADLSQVWVLLDAYETDLGWIRKGSAVDFSVASLPGQLFSSAVTYIDPVLNPQTRTAGVRLEVQNPHGLLKPDMFVRATVKTEVALSMQVPTSAVLWTGPRSVVYVRVPNRENPSFEIREVVLGARAGDYQIIVDGVLPGEEVVVNGAFALDAAAQLGGKYSMMQRPVDKSVDVPTAFKQEMDKLVAVYYQLKDALVAGDFAASKRMSANLLAKVKSVNAGGISAQAESVWQTLSGNMVDAMQHIGHAGDIEEVRHHFETVSDAIILAFESFGPAEIIVYVQYCPMAFDDKGASWLSNVDEIRNPYFGDAMLMCGEVTKTIKPAKAPEMPQGHVH